MKKKNKPTNKSKKVAKSNKKKVVATKKKVSPAKKKTPAAKKKVVVVKKNKADTKKKIVTKAQKNVVAVKKSKPAPKKVKVAVKLIKKPVAVKKPEPVAKSVTIVKKKQQAKPKKLPIQKIVKAPEPEVKITKSGRVRVQFEYFTRSSVGVLYSAVSTASGLAAWFAEHVDSQDNLFIFLWEGSEERALLLEAVQDEYVRFRWLEQPDDCFFEFRIKIDGVTNEVALVVTDYVEKGEENESQLLWDSQVHELMHILGS